MKRSKNFLALLLAAMMLLSLAGCNGNQSNTPSNNTPPAANNTPQTPEPGQSEPAKDFSGTAINIGCGTQGGFYYLYGFAIASALESYIPGLTATAMVTSASSENARRVSDGDCEVGFICTDIAIAAMNGEGDYERPYPDLRHLISGNVQACQLVVRADSPIQSYKDLVGRSVAVSTGNTFTQIFPGIMEGFGLKAEDAKLVALATNECIEALRDNTVEAAFVAQAPPYSVITDLALSVNLRIIEIPEDIIEKILTDIKPYWGRMSVPAGTYNGINEEVKTVGLVNALYVNKDLEDDLVYEILKVVDTKADELAISHPDAVTFVSSNNPFMGAGVPVHPGAVKYYEDNGITVPAELMP